MLESITLDELITALKRIKSSRGLSGDEVVVSCSNYGDRSNTLQAIFLGTLETCTLTDTCYSESGYKIVEGDPEDNPDSQVVVCLNYPE